MSSVILTTQPERVLENEIAGKGREAIRVSRGSGSVGQWERARCANFHFGVCGTRTSGDSFACRARLVISRANCSYERTALAAVT